MTINPWSPGGSFMVQKTAIKAESHIPDFAFTTVADGISPIFWRMQPTVFINRYQKIMFRARRTWKLRTYDRRPTIFLYRPTIFLCRPTIYLCQDIVVRQTPTIGCHSTTIFRRSADNTPTTEKPLFSNLKFTRSWVPLKTVVR